MLRITETPWKVPGAMHEGPFGRIFGRIAERISKRITPGDAEEMLR